MVPCQVPERGRGVPASGGGYTPHPAYDALMDELLVNGERLEGWINFDLNGSDGRAGEIFPPKEGLVISVGDEVEIEGHMILNGESWRRRGTFRILDRLEQGDVWFCPVELAQGDLPYQVMELDMG